VKPSDRIEHGATEMLVRDVRINGSEMTEAVWTIAGVEADVDRLAITG
jgi:hypothetical protein